jgi:hypothetical protein
LLKIEVVQGNNPREEIGKELGPENIPVYLGGPSEEGDINGGGIFGKFAEV